MPTRKAFSRHSSDIHAVSATTGMREVLGFRLSIAVVLTPSTSGRFISMKIRSGPSASAHTMASLLLRAFIASYPNVFTRRPKISRESLLSSTIRIFLFTGPLLENGDRMILVGACPEFSTLDYKKWPSEPYIVIFAEGEVSLI